MKRKLLMLVLAVAAGCAVMSAQSRSKLRINEVMVQNDSNMVDDYGQHSAWIELFNSNYAPLEISSVYLSTDPQKDPKKRAQYPVPLGDELTKIGKRQHVLFWADGEPTRGTFHLNFRLNPGQDNTIWLYDADGITLIDSVVVPAAATVPGVSYARHAELGDSVNVWEIRDNSSAKLYVTPSSANQIKDVNPKVKKFAEEDANGFGMTVVAMGIVFSALFVLCLCFLAISRIGAHFQRERKREAHGLEPAAAGQPVARTAQDSGEEIAAVVMALHQHFNAHDQESAVLTINKVKRAYSPWSSKIYNMREIPRR